MLLRTLTCPVAAGLLEVVGEAEQETFACFLLLKVFLAGKALSCRDWDMFTSRGLASKTHTLSVPPVVHDVRFSIRFSEN